MISAYLRVLLVEDHALVRTSIQQMLEKAPHVEVVGGAASGEEGVEMARDLRPDVVLMDITLPGMNGIEATREIVRERPETKVLMLTMHDAKDHEMEALRAGAVGYIHKNTDPDVFWSKMDMAAKGHVVITPASARHVIGGSEDTASGGHRLPNGEVLTARDIELLRSVVRGLTSKEIAANLSLSEPYVRTQLSVLYVKLGVTRRSQAAVYAVEHKLI